MAKELGFIPLTTHSTDVPDYPGGYVPNNMLYIPNTDEEDYNYRNCYCTASGYGSNVNLVLKLDVDQTKEMLFLARKVKVEVPKYGYTAPLKDGLVFFSLNVPDKAYFPNFDDFSSSQFASFVNHEKEENLYPDLTPVCYFELKSEETETNVSLDTFLVGKFIYLKLLKSVAPEINIDVAFFGVNGVCFSLDELNEN
eukprot:TRINITY_DN103_c0_g1_i2.p1 TRINITY_DN103_c0_g1~~TRINITY_DN103_c0_g1_i2.p1  ORF type:complete len:197 (-),score=38.10 TRINITY_DN103_c0_g1_i2:62-652(-)